MNETGRARPRNRIKSGSSSRRKPSSRSHSARLRVENGSATSTLRRRARSPSRRILPANCSGSSPSNSTIRIASAASSIQPRHDRSASRARLIDR